MHTNIRDRDGSNSIKYFFKLFTVRIPIKRIYVHTTKAILAIIPIIGIYG